MRTPVFVALLVLVVALMPGAAQAKDEKRGNGRSDEHQPAARQITRIAGESARPPKPTVAPEPNKPAPAAGVAPRAPAPAAPPAPKPAPPRAAPAPPVQASAHESAPVQVEAVQAEAPATQPQRAAPATIVEANVSQAPSSGAASGSDAPDRETAQSATTQTLARPAPQAPDASDRAAIADATDESTAEPEIIDLATDPGAVVAYTTVLRQTAAVPTPEPAPTPAADTSARNPDEDLVGGIVMSTLDPILTGGRLGLLAAALAGLGVVGLQQIRRRL